MRYHQLIEKIDQINNSDPNRENLDGKSVAKEVAYSHRMRDRLQSFYPDAPEILKIAVYAQHINRWQIARNAYPMDRQGYLRWRSDLADHHAQLTGQLMTEVGYSDEEIGQVRSIIKKKNLKTDVLVQTLEDVACLVFLDYYLAAMMTSHSEEKLISVIQKTWQKMSDAGRKRALEIDYTAAQRDLLERALQASSAA